MPMDKVCSQCSASFEITDDDLAFYKEIAPVFNGKQFPIPSPMQCPACRLQRRLLFRNERKLYKRNSGISRKPMVTMFAPDNPYKTCSQEEWFSDTWDPMAYGKECNFSHPFFDQLRALNLAVPHPGLNNTNVENSEYTNYALNQKNCYLIFGAADNEDCLYGKFVIFSKNTTDCLSVYSCEWCSEGVASQQCYGCHYFLNCHNCSDCFMIEDCSGCKNCIMCFGLRQREYCILNKQLTREEFLSQKAALYPLTSQKIGRMQQQLNELQKNLPHIGSHIYASEDCTGDAIYNSKGCKECFDINHCEDCHCTAFTPNGVSSYDSTYSAPDGVQWCNNVTCTIGHRCLGTYMCWYTNDVYYSINCRQCDFCFGCVGLRNKKYCIFNRQYTKEDYEVLAGRIAEKMTAAGEWGHFLPPDLSHFAYNETIAQEYFPLTREQALALSFRWRPEDAILPDAKKTIPGEQLPDTIGNIPDDILHWAIICSATKKPFRITKPELDFYRRMELPVPRLHPDERHRLRLAKKKPYRLWNRTCAKCQKPIATSFAPDRPEIVYCETCYLSEVY